MPARRGCQILHFSYMESFRTIDGTRDAGKESIHGGLQRVLSEICSPFSLESSDTYSLGPIGARCLFRTITTSCFFRLPAEITLGTEPQMTTRSIAVLGTGMAGLGAGHFLELQGAPFICYDQNSYHGGHTRSRLYENGFVFDEGGHISFTTDARVGKILSDNVDGQHLEQKLKIDNYWHGHRIRHPVQCNLWGLPTALVAKIIEDFVSISSEGTNDGSVRLPTNKSKDCYDRPPETYFDWLLRAYGKTFAETFPIVYGEKYHTTKMDQLTTDWIGPRMYKLRLDELLRGALGPSVSETHYVQGFRYPLKGGFVSYLEPFSKRFDTRLNHRLVGLNPQTKLLRFANGVTCSHSAVVSSIPLPELIPLIEGAPLSVIEAVGKLAFTSAFLFNIGVDREDISETAITYFYDEDICVSRVNLPHMFSSYNAPVGCGAIQAEVYFSDKYKALPGDPSALFDIVISDLRRCGFIRDNDTILVRDVMINRYANIIYDFDRSSALATVHAYLDEVGIFYCGRYGNWDHSWTDQAFVSGEQCAMQAWSRM